MTYFTIYGAIVEKPTPDPIFCEDEVKTMGNI